MKLLKDAFSKATDPAFALAVVMLLVVWYFLDASGPATIVDKIKGATS